MSDRAAVLQFIWPFVRPYWRRLAVAMFGLALAAGAMLAIGEGLKRVVDQGFAAGSGAELDRILLVMVALALAQGVGIYIRFSNIAWVNNRVVNDIRQRVYGHLLTLSPAFFERERVGDVLSRLTNDTQVLESVVSNAFSWALRNLVMMIGALVMLALTSPRLLVFVLIGTPLVIAPVVLLGRRVRQLAKDGQDRLADAMARGDETIHAVRTVQAYAQETFEQRRFAERIDAVFVNAAARERSSALLSATVVVLAFIAISIILWVGGQDVLAGRMSAGQLSAFVFYAVMVATAVGAISEVFGQLKRAGGSSVRIRELLAARSDIVAPAAPVALSATRGDIHFEAVRFAYPTRPQHAALAAITGPQDEVEKMRVAFQRRRDVMVAELRGIPGVTCHMPEGAFYAFADCRGLYGVPYKGKPIASDEDVAFFLLDEAHVAAVPGGAFGAPGFVRFSYATSEERIQNGIASIRRAIEAAKRA